MKQFIKLTLLILLSGTVIKPTAPINKKVYASPAPIKVVQVDKPQTEPTPVETPASVPEPEPVVTPVQAPVIDQSEDYYRDWVFQHESGDRLDAVNSIGCYGLGQDCNNALANACPDWRTNRDCQLSFWQGYMSRRYGTWANAYSFWTSHRWW